MAAEFIIFDKKLGMVFKQVYKTNDKNQIIVQLPENFRKNKQVLVMVDDSFDTKNEKIAQLKAAANDPLFLSDVVDISKDFSFTDQELE